jgi:hypothetical protein
VGRRAGLLLDLRSGRSVAGAAAADLSGRGAMNATRCARLTLGFCPDYRRREPAATSSGCEGRPMDACRANGRAPSLRARATSGRGEALSRAHSCGWRLATVRGGRRGVTACGRRRSGRNTQSTRFCGRAALGAIGPAKPCRWSCSPTARNAGKSLRPWADRHSPRKPTPLPRPGDGGRLDVERHARSGSAG